MFGKWFNEKNPEDERLLGVFERLVHDEADKHLNRADNTDDTVVADLRLGEEEHKTDYEKHRAADHKFSAVVFGEDALEIEGLSEVVQLVILSTSDWAVRSS